MADKLLGIINIFKKVFKGMDFFKWAILIIATLIAIQLIEMNGGFDGEYLMPPFS